MQRNGLLAWIILVFSRKKIFKNIKSFIGLLQNAKSRNPNSLHSDKKLEYPGPILIRKQ
jgi:hypothetical protein